MKKRILAVGMAMKFCNNATGVLSPKPYLKEAFAATHLNLINWTYFQEQLVDIYDRAIKDFRLLLSDDEVDREKFESDCNNF